MFVAFPVTKRGMTWVWPPRAIRDGKWKWHIYPKIKYRPLFDLSIDPYEMIDLANDPPKILMSKRCKP